MLPPRVIAGAPALARGAGGLVLRAARPVTLGDTIHLKGRTSPSLLVHEAVHVWQFHRLGASYVVDAVAGQLSPTGYDWRAGLACGVQGWGALNLEAQAQCVQDLHARGAFAPGPDRPAAPVVVDGVAYDDLAAEVAAALRQPGGAASCQETPKRSSTQAKGPKP